MRNKKIMFLVPLLILLISACGAGDDKNKTDYYPTYDTTREVNQINDSGNADQFGSGGLRHNINDNKDRP
jgi:hypothetical protein